DHGELADQLLGGLDVREYRALRAAETKVSLRSLSAPSTCSALTMRAMRRSILPNSSMLMGLAPVSCRNRGLG
ncbi:MAG: hypothetical protein ACREXY_17735, partial [Gammaproteobacteria bacterium]